MLPWISVAVSWTEAEPAVQALLLLYGHQNGYQLGQLPLEGSSVSGSVIALVTIAPVPLAISSELVGSTTQPPQFVDVEDPVGLAELYDES
jgi:hypothetical protein